MTAIPQNKTNTHDDIKNEDYHEGSLSSSSTTKATPPPEVGMNASRLLLLPPHYFVCTPLHAFARSLYDPIDV